VFCPGVPEYSIVFIQEDIHTFIYCELTSTWKVANTWGSKATKLNTILLNRTYNCWPVHTTPTLKRYLRFGSESSTHHARFSDLINPEGADTKGFPSEGIMYGVFTCGRCNTRNVRKWSRTSYEKGVVIAKCGGCEGQHLIADNYGWCGDEKNIEELLQKRGQLFKKLQTDVLTEDMLKEFLREDIETKQIVQEEKKE